MQTYYFSPETQVSPIEHKRKDAHIIHCMRSEKIYTDIHGMLCSFTFHLPLHLNYRINPERPTVKDWSRTQD